MSAERSNGAMALATENLSHCHLVHHKLQKALTWFQTQVSKEKGQ
jgi:hypothetical protein